MKRPFNITISNDKMTCFLQIIYTGEQINAAEIFNVLKYNNIIIGLDQASILNAVQTSCSQKINIGPVVVARGDTPQLNKTENIKFYVRFPEQEFKACSASMYKSPRMRSVESVKKGSAVAERQVLDDTVVKMNIFGQISKALALTPGHQVTITDKNQYIAGCDGFVVIENAVISVVPSRPLTVKIKISDDRLKAQVTIEKNEFEEIVPSAEDVIQIMKSARVKFGVNKRVIEDILAGISPDSSTFPISFTGAEGDEKTDGVDPHINIFFPVNQDDVNIPLQLLTVIGNDDAQKIFKHGETIAEIIKAKPGVSGRRVTGEVIKAKQPLKIALEYDFPVTKNEVEEENKIEIITGVGGKVELKGNKVMIQPYEDGYMEVKIAEDKLSAVLDFHPPAGGGKHLTFEACSGVLKRHVIKYGIDDIKIKAALAKLEKDKLPVKMVLAVKGFPPENGKDGDIKLYFKPQSTKPKMDALGNVDHYDLGTVPSVEKGKVIAEIIPPTKGKAGKDIFGNEVPPLPGRDLGIKAGLNVSISEDGKNFTALVEGCPKVEAGVLSVVEVFEIAADVNFTTGNISFRGDVIVNGNITSGFKVESLEGEVQVRGLVYGAVVKAKKDIKIANGIVGERKCWVYTEGNLMAKFIERASVDVAGNIEVGNYIMDSIVTSGRSIRAMAGRGLIIGGQTLAAEEIEAVTIGNEKGVKTQLFAGQRYDLIKRSDRLNKEKTKLDEHLAKIDNILKEAIEDETEKSEAEKKHRHKLEEQKKKLLRRINFLNTTLARINLQIEEEKGKLEGRVKIKEKCFSGVFVIINDSDYIVHTDTQSKMMVYDKEKDGIAVLPYKKDRPR